MEQNTEEVRIAYDSVAIEYNEKYFNELEYKPFDQEIIGNFLEELKITDKICDLGCGPGEAADFVNKKNFKNITGIDLSEKMIEIARKNNPDIDFNVKNIFDIDLKCKFKGIIGLYFIVNFPLEQLDKVFKIVYNMLEENGIFLLSFHLGNEKIEVKNFLDKGKKLDFYFFSENDILKKLELAEFNIKVIKKRESYKIIEYKSKRAYIIAKKIKNGGK